MSKKQQQNNNSNNNKEYLPPIYIVFCTTQYWMPKPPLLVTAFQLWKLQKTFNSSNKDVREIKNGQVGRKIKFAKSAAEKHIRLWRSCVGSRIQNYKTPTVTRRQEWHLNYTKSLNLCKYICCLPRSWICREEQQQPSHIIHDAAHYHFGHLDPIKIYKRTKQDIFRICFSFLSTFVKSVTSICWIMFICFKGKIKETMMMMVVMIRRKPGSPLWPRCGVVWTMGKLSQYQSHII